jgi:hypothetical protein
MWTKGIVVDKADSNRKNAQHSTGPHNTTGTRLNAVQHGLLAKGITELDDPVAYEGLWQRLNETYRPSGDVEEFLVQRIAFHIVRLRLAGRLEAEYITEQIHPPAKQNLFVLPEAVVVEPGEPAAVSALGALNLVSGFQRYETAIENKLYRAINQLERLQRMRLGEFVTPPQVVDVSIQSAGEREL